MAALLLGAFSILKTPREEEPQIVVPMLDVFVQMPGASPEEVSQRVSLPMERLLREVPGVEYVYSISQPGMSMLIVRFYVGIERRRRDHHRPTTSSTPTSIASRREFHSRSSRCARSMMSPSWRSRCGARTMTRIICAASPVSWKTHSSSSMMFRKPRSSEGSPGRYEWFWIRNGLAAYGLTPASGRGSTPEREQPQ